MSVEEPQLDVKQTDSQLLVSASTEEFSLTLATSAHTTAAEVERFTDQILSEFAHTVAVGSYHTEYSDRETVLVPDGGTRLADPDPGPAHVEHLTCDNCVWNPTVARVDGEPCIVCHCTHENGAINPYRIYKDEDLPARWQFIAENGASEGQK